MLEKIPHRNLDGWQKMKGKLISVSSELAFNKLSQKEMNPARGSMKAAGVTVIQDFLAALVHSLVTLPFHSLWQSWCVRVKICGGVSAES